MRVTAMLLVCAWPLVVGCWSAPAEGRFPCTTATVAADCPASWSCRADGLCWSTPDGDPDGGDLDGGDLDGGDRDGGITDASMFDVGPPARCGDGRVNDITASELVIGLHGAEVYPLPARRLGAVPTPQSSDGTVFPAFSLAMGASGYAALGTLAFSDSRYVLTRLDVIDWTAGTSEVPLGTAPPIRAFAVGPGPNDSQVVGLALAAAVADKGPAGFGFTYDGAGTPGTTPIIASAPAHVTRSQATTVGGMRAVDSVSAPPWVIAHELESGPGPNILGAVSATDGFVQYRTTLVPFLVPDLYVTGSFSNLVLIQMPETFEMRIWDVAATADYVDGATRTDETLELGSDFMARGIAAIERLGPSPTDHVLAMPTVRGGTAAVDLYRFGCSETECLVQFPETSTLPLPGGVSPRQVDIVRLPQGYALVIVDADGRTVHLRLLDDSLDVVTLPVLDAPWFVMPEPFEIAFIAAAVTDFPDGAVLLVGALGRDARGGTDQVMVAGYRSCTVE